MIEVSVLDLISCEMILDRNYLPLFN